MKKFIILATAFFFSLISNAQAQLIPRGSITGGGTLGLSIGKDRYESGGSTVEYRRFGFNVAPALQYYVADDLGIGGIITIAGGSSKADAVEYNVSSISVMAGPAVRYYAFKGLFLRASYAIGVTKSTYKTNYQDSESSVANSQADVAVGYSIRVNDHVLLDPVVGYEASGIRDNDQDSNSTSGGIYLRIGFTMILKRN